MTVTEARPVLEKLTYNDDQHAYWITPGGRCKSASGIAKILEDGYALEKWGKRQLLVGVATAGPSILDRIAAHFDDRDALDSIAAEALVHAKTHQAADRGTAMHRATERHDNNEIILATPLLTATIEAWARALDEADLEVVPEYVECIVAYPEHKVCGRMDRIVRRRSDGRLFILDLKSGARAVKYPHSIAIQLAVYANAPVACRISTASGSTTEFFELPAELDRTTALIVHMPTPEECSIYPVDIAAGWEIVRGAVFPALMWNKRDDLIGPPIIEASPVVAPQEDPPPGAAASPTTREWLRERITELRALDPEAPGRVARLLPEGITPLKGRDLLSKAEFELYDRAIAAVERELEAPFIGGGPVTQVDGWIEKLDATDGVPPTIEPPPPVYDEGRRPR